MNKTNRLLTTLVVLIIVLFCGCEKDDIKPAKGRAFGKLEIIHGDNQTGYFGEFLADSIVIKASSTDNHRRYLIKWEVVQGNGSIVRDYYNIWYENHVDSTGLLKIRWRLGCDVDIQKIKLTLYIDSTKNVNGYINYFTTPSDSLIISANGMKPTGWARSCGCNDLAYSSKIITYDNSKLFLVSRGLYSSTDDGINWYKVEGVPDWANIVDAQFNSLGWLYVLTQNNGICYSKDLHNWEFINNGILDHRDPTTFLVEDSTLFVSFYFDGPYKTSNNGGFWRKMLVGRDAQRFYHISRHPSGDIYLFDDWGNLWISENYGKIWKQVNVEYKYADSPIHDLEIDAEGYIYIGADDATISKLSSDTYTGEVHKYYVMNHSSQHVEDIKVINNIVYFYVNGSLTPGIYSSQNWQRVELGFNGVIGNYFLKKDGTFLLISNGGLYYYNE